LPVGAAACVPNPGELKGYNRAMNDSMAQPRHGFSALELSGWKTALSWLAAVLVGLLFIVSGIWKITGVQGAAMRMAQAKVPESLSVAAALGFGIVETVAGVLVIVPRFRRWGAFLTAALLAAFMIYVGIHYTALSGEDCSCFPWLKRAVGPGFFIGDTVMLLLAVVAGVWSRRPSAMRSAVLVCGAIAVFGFVSYGVEIARQAGGRAPDTLTIAGKPEPIGQGKLFLFFFDPACSHCMDSARKMSRFDWGETRVIAVPVELMRYAQGFLDESGLKAQISTDFEKVRETFHYKAYPYAVVIEDGIQKAALARFEGDEPAASLKRLGFIR
jgi:uncharacterized membrane protein YphA (DoxX/SURF4 family)